MPLAASSAALRLRRSPESAITPLPCDINETRIRCDNTVNYRALSDRRCGLVPGNGIAESAFQKPLTANAYLNFHAESTLLNRRAFTGLTDVFVRRQSYTIHSKTRTNY